ncbi:MAG: ribosome-associated translation inhibitor RaiA [Planctomycetia bacterium]|nr:ribosome-associated translation inhibitor RaiA [Planctomycetia bacterium]
MNIDIQTRHIEINDALKAKISDKVEKLGRFVERVTNIEVLISAEAEGQVKVEIALNTDYKKDFRADYKSGDIMGCVDQSIDKLEQQLRKFKEKMVDHH